MTSTTGATMPRIAKFTHIKDLPFREYTLVLTPNGGDRNYTWSDIVSFRISLGNDKLRCVYGSQTYGTFQIQLTFSDIGGNAVDSTMFDGSANSIFNRITTTSNGGVLEDFNKCNVYKFCDEMNKTGPIYKISFPTRLINIYLVGYTDEPLEDSITNPPANVILCFYI